MSVATTIKVICDECLNNDDTEIEGTEFNIVISNRAWNIDLCDAHADKLVTPLSLALEVNGRAGVAGSNAATAPQRRRKKRILGVRDVDPEDISPLCPLPGCDYETTGNPRDRIRMHLRREHHVDLGAVLNYGAEAAMKGEGAEFICTLDECKNNPNYFSSGTGFATHLRANGRYSHALDNDAAQREMKAARNRAGAG